MKITGTEARLVSVQVGMPQVFQDTHGDGKVWTSGIIKTPVQGTISVNHEGLSGDGQADRKNHGGIDKAILVYCLDHLDSWRERFPQVTWEAGAFGENFSLSGVQEQDVCVGDLWAIGDCEFEVSQPRQPCWKLSRRWGIPKLAVHVQQTRRTGWYCRVKRPGMLEAPAALTLVKRPFPDVTIDWANQVMYAKPRNARDDQRLAECPALAQSWREHLLQRSG